MPIERIYERDVDLLLAEEFDVNSAFADHIKSLTKFAGEPATVAETWISKSDNLGESDLVVVYQRSDAGRFALLIEDKVDANLQPDQAGRYRMRAEREISRGSYADFEVVLCAPAFYLRNRGDLDDFDRRISFEDIADFLDAGDRRSKYRAGLLRMAAGTRKINAWVREDDPATDAFWSAAYDLACSEFPILEMKRPSLTKDSVWITFRPHGIPTMPKRVSLELKGKSGDVDLTFGNTIAYLLQPRVAHLLQPDMTVHQTNAAAAIRLRSAAFRIADGIPAGILKVRAAFRAASRLIEFYRAHAAELDRHAKAATPDP